MAHGKKRSYATLLLCIVSSLLLPFAYLMTDSLLTTLKINQSLQKQSQLLWETNRKDYKKLKQKQVEVEILQAEKKEIEKERDRLGLVAVVYEFYRDSGMLYKYWWINKKYIYNLIIWREKYSYLGAGFNYDIIGPVRFYFDWICNESNGNPNKDFIVTNKEGKKDFFVMQMNECHYLEKDLKKNLWHRARTAFPHLKNRPDHDPELNVCVWNIWMGEQKTHGVWLIWNGDKKRGKPGWTARKDVMELDRRLKECNYVKNR